MAHKGEKSNGSHYTSPRSRMIESSKYSLDPPARAYADVIIESSYSGSTHPSNQTSGYQGGSTEYERKGILPSSFKTPNLQKPSSNIEAINIISSPPEQGVFGRVSKRIPRTPLGGREEPTHMREERQRMKGGPPQVRPSEQAGKGKRPLVFVGDKQWNEYLNFNKRKRYDD